ncbi:MAG: prolyl oligopeptidase family serine peptidase [Gemmatimonadota bacterium]|nr:prolyl oligopeptidase family serine peptidase [Gemmatimonadota bacterium]
MQQLRRIPTTLTSALAALLLPALAASTASAQDFSVADVLSPGFPYALVSADAVDRIAWLEYERGMRNVYTATPPGFEPTRLTDFLKDDGVDLQNLQLSTDGEVVTFLRGHQPNREGWVANPTSDPRGAERAIWAMSSRGGTPWRVAEATSYTLSPDGRWVAFARDGQIHRAPVNSGAGVGTDTSEPFFTAYGRNADPVWAPDARRIAYESDRGDHSFIGVYDARSPAITYLSPGVDRDFSPTWSPDGTRVAFLRRPGDPFGARADLGDADPEELPAGLIESRFAGGHLLEIWIADAATGEGRRLWHSSPGEEEGFAEIRSIEWRGGHIVFQAEPGNWQHWYSISVDDPRPEPVELTPGDGFVMQVAFSKDGRTLFYSSNHSDIDRRDLWSVPVAGGQPRQLTRGDAIETYPAALASGGQLATLYADARQPQSVAVLPSSGGDARVITPLPAEYPRSAHVVPTNVTLTAEDGIAFNSQLFLPPDLRPGERRPALIFIHGGSRRQMLLGYHHRHFYHMAYAMNQYWASQGYIVMSVNYRSGIGYGKEFRESPGRGREGNTEYRDILAAGLYLHDRDDVDTSRVGLWGLSYGGILTAQGLARNSDLFAAGVDIAGVHLWGNSLDPESVSYQASSISEIENWTSPVLLIHGDDDRNVDFSQTVGLVQALRAHDVEYELIVFPDDVHDSLLFHRWIEAFEASDDFLTRKLKNRSVATDGGGR